MTCRVGSWYRMCGVIASISRRLDLCSRPSSIGEQRRDGACFASGGETGHVVRESPRWIGDDLEVLGVVFLRSVSPYPSGRIQRILRCITFKQGHSLQVRSPPATSAARSPPCRNRAPVLVSWCVGWRGLKERGRLEKSDMRETDIAVPTPGGMSGSGNRL